MFYVAIKTKAIIGVNTGGPGRNMLHIFKTYEEGKSFVEKAEKKPNYVDVVGYWDDEYDDIVVHD